MRITPIAPIQLVSKRGVKKYTEAELLDKKYIKWTQQQQSALSQTFGEFYNGKGYNDAAHWRHAGNAGWGMKPLFSVLPLTHKEHMRQHGTSYKQLQSEEWWKLQIMLHQIRFERETGLKIPDEYRMVI